MFQRDPAAVYQREHLRAPEKEARIQRVVSELRAGLARAFPEEHRREASFDKARSELERRLERICAVFVPHYAKVVPNHT